jgi:hypothetical protein
MTGSLPQLFELLGVLRTEITNHPLLFFFGIFALVTVAGRVRRSDHDLRRSLGMWLSILGLLGTVGYVVTVLWYVQLDQYADAAEPTVAAVAWLFELGLPIYHGMDSAERYSHMYGPMAFIIPGWSLAVLGPDIRTSKIAGAAAGILSVAIVFLLMRTAGDRRSALALTGLYGLMCLMFQNVSFWIRPDSFQLLVATGALYCVAALPGRFTSPIVLGLAAGVLADLKFTGPLYVLPAFAVLVANRRWAAIAAASALAVIVASLPFVVYENVSLSNFVLWARMSASNGLLGSLMRRNTEWALFLMLPLAACFRLRALDSVERWILGSIVAGVALVTIAASKPGAGPYHLLPFAPAILYVTARSLNRIGAGFLADVRVRPMAKAFAWSVAIVAALQIVQFVHAATRTRGLPIAEDLRRTTERYAPSTIGMGYSSQNEAYAYVRPVLVFRQGRYLLDAPAVQEHQLSGLQLGTASIQAIETCGNDIWLMPKGGDPFSLASRYPQTGHAPLFPEAFRAAFHKAYHHTAATDYFDVWVCRAVR